MLIMTEDILRAIMWYEDKDRDGAKQFFNYWNTDEEGRHWILYVLHRWQDARSISIA